VVGTAPTRELVVEWRDVPTYACPAATLRFQTVFFEGSSDLLFNYADTVVGDACAESDHGGQATVGVQVAANRATQYGYNAAVLANPLALLWTTGPASEPVISLIPTAVDFGSVPIGSAVDRTVTIENLGGGVLTGSAMTAAPFSIVSGGAFNLGALESQPLVVRFRPTVGGPANGAVSVTSNAANTVPPAPVTGTTPALPPAGSDDLIVDFGAPGVWVWANNATWLRLHAVSPEEMATGDLDGNGKADLILDLPSYGIWVWKNNAAWSQLHVLNANQIVTADLDGNGKDDVLVDFPGYGLWVYMNDATWSRLHLTSPTRLVTGDLDGNGKDEAIIDFTGAGVWIWQNNTSWSQLHAANAAALVVGDMDGNGKADVLLDFPGSGLWLWADNTSWLRLHTADATVMTTGDIDGNGQADAIVSFPGYGVWAWMNNTGWTKLHAIDAALLTAGDIDASGKCDLIISFPGYGIWVWQNNAGWFQLHTLNPQRFVTANLDVESRTERPLMPAIVQSSADRDPGAGHRVGCASGFCVFGDAAGVVAGASQLRQERRSRSRSRIRYWKPADFAL
jgi:hypothetical protein